MELMATINGFDLLMLAVGYFGGFFITKKSNKIKQTNFKYYGRWNVHNAHKLRFVTSLSEYNEDKLETTTNWETERKWTQDTWPLQS